MGISVDYELPKNGVEILPLEEGRPIPLKSLRDTLILDVMVFMRIWRTVVLELTQKKLNMV